MFDYLIFLLIFCVCNLVIAVIKYVKYKSYDSIFEREVITKRIYKNCKRKWSCDKKGTLKARYKTFEAYVNSCVNEEFKWRLFL